MTIRDIHPAQDIPALFESVSQEVARLERRHRKKDGALTDVEVTTNNLDWVGRLARLAVVTDFTERRRTEKQPRQSEESYRRLVERGDRFAGGVALAALNVNHHPLAVDVPH